MTARAGYREIAAELRARITSGDLQPGQRIPSGRDLSQTYDVAAMTARKAVEQLRLEGLIEPVRGKGFVVRDQGPVTVVKLHRGSRTRVRPATEEERDRLGLDVGSWVVEIHRRYQPPGNHSPIWRLDVYPGEGHEFINS